jgi:hypothetical protein
LFYKFFFNFCNENFGGFYACYTAAAFIGALIMSATVSPKVFDFLRQQR